MPELELLYLHRSILLFFCLASQMSCTLLCGEVSCDLTDFSGHVRLGSNT